MVLNLTQQRLLHGLWNYSVHENVNMMLQKASSSRSAGGARDWVAYLRFDIRL